MRLILLFSVLASMWAEEEQTIVVGDDPSQFNMGWSDGVCYLPIEHVHVGDVLEFNFFFGHNVCKMPDAKALGDCDFTNAALLASDGPFKYKIREVEDLYFACEVSSHCNGEQRLQVRVENSINNRTEVPISKFLLGTSSSSCQAVRDGLINPDAASRMDETECSAPEYRTDSDRPYYHRSCLGPPITLTPGGVINQALILNFPFPLDRRVLLGTRTWEFVQGDLENLEPVLVSQLYIHHIAGSVVLGNGAENIRQSEEDEKFPLPYGILSGDIDDRMIFHLIDLRMTNDTWLECLECRCKDGEGTYLGFGGSGSEGGPEGGVSCCRNCTNLTTPTIDYRLRYNVTYAELTDLAQPVRSLDAIATDVSPAINMYVEWDVPMHRDLPFDQVLPSKSKIQVLQREGTLRELFGGFFPGSRYTGPNFIEVHRCIGHLHVAALGMWLYDAMTDEIICHNDVEYGTGADEGFLKTITVTNYNPPLQMLADRRVRVVTHYNATILHTGVMGLLFLFIAEDQMEVGPEEGKLFVDLCSAPRCDVGAALPNGGCRDALEDSIMCTFGGVCECRDLLNLRDTVGGCSGTYMSNFGNVSVGSLCAHHCGCGEDLLEESIVEQKSEKTTN